MNHFCACLKEILAGKGVPFQLQKQCTQDIQKYHVFITKVCSKSNEFVTKKHEIVYCSDNIAIYSNEFYT